MHGSIAPLAICGRHESVDWLSPDHCLKHRRLLLHSSSGSGTRVQEHEVANIASAHPPVIGCMCAKLALQLPESAGVDM
jgi:hypothetical protein